MRPLRLVEPTAPDVATPVALGEHADRTRLPSNGGTISWAPTLDFSSLEHYQCGTHVRITPAYSPHARGFGRGQVPVRAGLGLPWSARWLVRAGARRGRRNLDATSSNWADLAPPRGGSSVTAIYRRVPAVAGARERRPNAIVVRAPIEYKHGPPASLGSRRSNLLHREFGGPKAGRGRSPTAGSRAG